MGVRLCDEAYRIRKTSNERFTKRHLRSSISQTRELIRAARVSVFFLDERQNVRPDEIGSVAAIEEAAAEERVPVLRVPLDCQFRCNGCSAYLEWVNALMLDSPVQTGGWIEAGEYDLRLYHRPGDMERAIGGEIEQGRTARLVAGFCWPWSDPGPDGPLAPDVVIDDWQRPWNEKAPDRWKRGGSAPRPDRHPYYRWATQPGMVREVGCIYSAQGFEFDYCGVIIGNDLVWRDGAGWVASRDASYDIKIARRRLSQGELLALLQHTYRVLLTRGMKGTFIYSTDYETREMLRRAVGR